MTRSILLALPLALALGACAVDAPVPADDVLATESAAPVRVGEPLDAGLTVLTAADVSSRAAELDGQTVAVEGEVSAVCQQKGCWLTLANDTGTTFRVSVPKDEAGEYVYTFPTDVAGRRARIAGTLSVADESVETLRHLAEDAGQSADEIAAITEPKRTISLTATGAELDPADA